MRKTGGMALASTAAAGCATQPVSKTREEREAGPGYNLLWIMTDQQPLSCVGAYGNRRIHTPNFDRLAGQGVIFEQCYIAGFPCSPSRGCLMTGREVHHHRVVVNEVWMPLDLPQVGSILKQAGYRTGHFGKWHLGGNVYRHFPSQQPFDGNWHLGRVPDPERFKHVQVEGGTGEDGPVPGFDEWRGGWKQYRDYLRQQGFDQMVAEGAGCHNPRPASWDQGEHSWSTIPAEHHMDAFHASDTIRFIEQGSQSGQPWAAVLSFWGPHPPASPPQPWERMYKPEEMKLPDNFHDTLENKPAGQKNSVMYHLDDWSKENFQSYLARYWGYTSFVDEQLGRVLDALEATGQAERTLVLFVSDHGDMNAAHGFSEKMFFCGYEELFHTPFLMSIPGGKPGRRISAQVSTLDILPTVLEVLGTDGPDQLDGRSMMPLLEGRTQEHRPFCVGNSGEHSFVVVEDHWKYVCHWNPDFLDELYDLEKDPGEMRNLAAETGAESHLRHLRERLADWLETSGHPYRETVLAAMKS